VRGTLATAAAAFALLISAQAALAETSPDAKAIGKFGEWEAAWFMDNGDKVCYMAAKPVSTASDKPIKKGGRDPAFLFITHWPADDEKNAVTVSEGFALKQGSKAIITVDGQAFTMATGGRDKATADADAQMAWMEDQKKEDELALAISKGSKLTVKGTSQRGNNITDTYSLSGSGEAYKAITRECGY
jgi:hypothetical protein